MSEAQQKLVENVRKAVEGCGGRIVSVGVAEDGATPLVTYEGVDRRTLSDALYKLDPTRVLERV